MALFATAYYGLFRIGEITDSQHAVKARDVHIGQNKRKLLFLLRTSKTHGENVEPQSIKIASTKKHNTESNRKVSSEEDWNFCLYSLLKA